jgi:biopolymer transport protein ExbB/TolQ
MSLALIGWPVLEFIFVAIVAISIGAALLYTVLGLFYAVDRVIDYVYTAR